MHRAVLLAMVMPAMACVAPPNEDDATTADSETPADTDAPTDTDAPPTDTDAPPSDTDEPPTDTDAPPSDTDDPTGAEPAPGCADAPVASATFAVELDGWPATRESQYQIEAPCTVTAVEELETEVVTTLECDDDGELRPATLRIAASPEGAPSWGPASPVVLAYSFLEDSELGTGIYHTVSLRQADDQALLIAGVDSDTLTGSKWLGSAPDTYLDPLVTTEDQGYCGWAFDDSVSPMRVGFALDGASLDLVSGQRGTLPIAGQTDRLAVDLAEATVGHCCHYLTWFRLLVRRVS